MDERDMPQWSAFRPTALVILLQDSPQRTKPFQAAWGDVGFRFNTYVWCIRSDFMVFPVRGGSNE